MQYSIIILSEHEYDDLPQFIENLHDVFSSRQVSYELIVVANGIGRWLCRHLKEFQKYSHRLKVFAFNTKTTQAVCLNAGLRKSSGDIIVVCGSYQQITNESLIKLLDALDDETDIIHPWRPHRIDSILKRLQSSFFNALVRKITKCNLRDLSCMGRVIRRDVFEDLEIYGNLLRFLPIVAARKGFKIKQVKCKHYQERGKSGFYSPSEYFNRIIDIVTLYFTIRFSRKPLRFFSAIGLGFLIVGLLNMSYIFVQKLLVGSPIGDRSLLLVSIFFMFLGVQVASIGLLGEIIAFTYGRHRKEYTIEKII